MEQIKLRRFDLSSHVKYLMLCGFSFGLVGAIIVPIYILMQMAGGFTNLLGLVALPIVIVLKCTICGAVVGLISYIPLKWVMRYKNVLELRYIKCSEND